MTKQTDKIVRLPHSQTGNFDDIAADPRWVAWKVAPDKNGEPTKVPINPHNGFNARVPTNPSTWGTRSEAERRWRRMQLDDPSITGGIGVVLGKLSENVYLVGIDLDSCRDRQGVITDWAWEIMKRIETYAEVSPSGAGVKLYFLMDANDWNKLKALINDLTRKTFAFGKHQEVAIDTARFYAVTGHHVEGTATDFVLTPFAEVEWFVKTAGPAYLAARRRENDEAANYFEQVGIDQPAQVIDESGSGYGFRFMRDCHAQGLSYDKACEAILADEAEAGEWANRVDERQLKRAYDNSKPKPTVTRFKLVPFHELRPNKQANSLVRGLIPRVGLVVIWGPPKCFKSFLTFDLALHVALGREYRGRRVQQGTVVYCAFEGAKGFGNRAEGARGQLDIPADQNVPLLLQPMRANLVKDHKALIRDIAAQTITPSLVVLDTLNRSLQGSESSDEDMSAYVQAADAIREAFDCCVIIVHHCGVEGTRPRGHTSLSGAVDAQLAVARERDTFIASMKVEWMKDGPEGDVIESDLECVTVGKNEYGEDETTLVVKPSVVTIAMPRELERGQLSVAFRLLRQALDDAGEKVTINHVPRNRPVVTLEVWRSYCFAGMATRGEKQDSKRRAFQRAVEKLQGAGLIHLWENHVWI